MDNLYIPPNQPDAGRRGVRRELFFYILFFSLSLSLSPCLFLCSSVFSRSLDISRVREVGRGVGRGRRKREKEKEK